MRVSFFLPFFFFFFFFLILFLTSQASWLNQWIGTGLFPISYWFSFIIILGRTEHTVQALKHTFLCSLRSWVGLYIGEGSMPLIDFVDWVALDERGSGVFWSSLFYGNAFWHPLYTSRVLWCIASFSFIYNIFLLAYQKIKIK